MKLKLKIFLIIAAILYHSAAAVVVADQEIDQEKKYQQCMEHIGVKPPEALNIALIWLDNGGRAPARHCEAASLYALGEYEEAAARFELLAEDVRVGKTMPIVKGKLFAADPVMIASMYSQASKAWLAAREIERAYRSSSKALAVAPNGTSFYVELLLERAKVAGFQGDFELSLEDINAALIFQSENIQALTFMASAKRNLGYLAEAKAAIDKAYSIVGYNAEIILERAMIHFSLGDEKAARNDFLIIIKNNPNSIYAELATKNINLMDIQTGN